MKKLVYVAVLALTMTACGASTNETATPIDSIATEVVPAAATDVLPAASPVPGLGKVATDVVPAEPAK